MKKKNFFAQNKQFTFFLILAVLIILVAIFAPIVSGGIDPLKGDLNDALLAPRHISLERIKWDEMYLHV